MMRETGTCESEGTAGPLDVAPLRRVTLTVVLLLPEGRTLAHLAEPLSLAVGMLGGRVESWSVDES